MMQTPYLRPDDKKTLLNFAKANQPRLLIALFGYEKKRCWFLVQAGLIERMGGDARRPFDTTGLSYQITPAGRALAATL